MMSAEAYAEPNPTSNVVSPFITDEEATLLACARNGDSKAFECLVMPHRAALLRATQRILRNREDAEDAVQTAFLDAFRNLRGFHGCSRFSSWLTRIAMNAALMRLRTARRKRETSLDELTATGDAHAIFRLREMRLNPETQYLSQEGRTLLEQGSRKLPSAYIEVLHLRDMQEFSTEETARMLELPLGTVKARLHRARTKLIGHVQAIVTRKASCRNIKN